MLAAEERDAVPSSPSFGAGRSSTSAESGVVRSSGTAVRRVRNQRNTWDDAHPKKRLTAAMVAAERLTIRITAIDSLNSCWRLGQTTSLSSLTVSGRKPPDAAESAVASELLAEVSSEVGLVTEGGPGVDRVAGRHSAKKTPDWMQLNHPEVRI